MGSSRARQDHFDEDEWERSPVASYACFACGTLLMCSILAGAFVEAKQQERRYAGWLVVLSVVPALGILFVAYWMQPTRSVIFRWVAVTFFCGMVGALPVAIVEWLFQHGLLNPLTDADSAGSDDTFHRLVIAFGLSFFIASLVEELFKLVLIVTSLHLTRVSAPYGVVVLGLAGALGFATLENTSYVVRRPARTHARPTRRSRAPRNPRSSAPRPPAPSRRPCRWRCCGESSPCRCTPAPARSWESCWRAGCTARSGPRGRCGARLPPRSRRAHAAAPPQILIGPFLVHGLYDFLLMSSEIVRAPLYRALAATCAVVVTFAFVALVVSRVNRMRKEIRQDGWQRVDIEDAGVASCA